MIETINLLERVYNLGVEAGVQQIHNKIKEHCKTGKPVLIDDEVYFIQDSRQHLIEVMDQIDRENRVEKKKNYIVPMRKVIDGKCEEVKVIISAKTPYEAWCGAIYNFGEESGWLVYSEYDKYEQI